MHDIVDVGEAFSEQPLKQLYAHGNARPYYDGLPAFEFSKGQTEGKTDGDKHHHVHDDFGKQQHFALPDKPIVPKRIVPVAGRNAHGPLKKHCQTKQHYNIKKQKQPSGYPPSGLRFCLSI